MIEWPEFLDFASRQAFWTILVGMVSNASCAILGCFLVLRRMSMLGDALSHAVLPGLVLAFLVTNSTASLPMFLGAGIFAMLTAGLSRLLTSMGHTSEESGLGIVFTAFFAFGILLVHLYASNVHIDRDAVLEGAVEYVTIDTLFLFGREWPASLWVTGGVLAAVIGWLVLFWKEVKVASFDPAYATAIGLYGHTMLGILIVLVAVTVVAAFKVVGSVLVVAMLVVPAASAQLMCQNLANMIRVSVVFALVATAAGYWLAREWNTSSAGMMAVMTGLGYAGALLFSPSRGLISTRLQRRHVRAQIRAEDVLGVLYRWQEQQGPGAAIPPTLLTELAGPAFRPEVIRQLLRSGLIVQTEGGDFRLTTTGQQMGERIVQGHRLWESFLDSEFVLPGDHLHEAAHQMEHYLDQETRQQIDQQLGSPVADPHGRNIPPV